MAIDIQQYTVDLEPNNPFTPQLRVQLTGDRTGTTPCISLRTQEEFYKLLPYEPSGVQEGRATPADVQAAALLLATRLEEIAMLIRTAAPELTGRTGY